MKTKTKTKNPAPWSPEELNAIAENTAKWAADERAKLAKLDVHRPSAHGVRPLFRLALVNPEVTNLGYLLIDVVAVIPGERERSSKHVFPTYIGLALSAHDGKWKTVEVGGFDGAVELEEAYEVVS